MGQAAATINIRRTGSRWQRLGILLAAVSCLTLVGVVATAPVAQAESTNPFADAGGFTVYARNDASMNNTEIEGSLAVGGTLTVRKSGGGFSLIHSDAGTGDYTIPTVDGDPTRLLVNAYSTTSGIIQAKGGGTGDDPATGYAKIVAVASPFGFAQRGSYTQYRDLTDDSSAAEGPAIEGWNQPWVDNENGETFLTEQDSVAAYTEKGAGYAATSSCLTELADQTTSLAHHVTVTNDGGKASLALVSGEINVVDYADLLIGWQDAMADGITYSAAVPAADTPLIVRVPAGTTTVHGTPFGTSGQYSPYVMWDLSAVTGSVTITGSQGSSTRIDGSIYAPYADVTATFGPLDGQLIAKNLVTTSDSGEVHSYLFKGSISCEATSSASASSSATESASASASATESATATDSSTATASASATESATSSASTSATAGTTVSGVATGGTDITATTATTSASSQSSAKAVAANSDDSLASTGPTAVGLLVILGTLGVSLGLLLLRGRRSA